MFNVPQMSHAAAETSPGLINEKSKLATSSTRIATWKSSFIPASHQRQQNSQRILPTEHTPSSPSDSAGRGHHRFPSNEAPAVLHPQRTYDDFRPVKADQIVRRYKTLDLVPET